MEFSVVTRTRSPQRKSSFRTDWECRTLSRMAFTVRARRITVRDPHLAPEDTGTSGKRERSRPAGGSQASGRLHFLSPGISNARCSSPPDPPTDSSRQLRGPVDHQGNAGLAGLSGAVDEEPFSVGSRVIAVHSDARADEHVQAKERLDVLDLEAG